MNQGLYHYREIHREHRGALLAGNGLSIAYSDRFRYDSLFNEARLSMDSKVQLTFEMLETKNFEAVLHALGHAIGINGAFDIRSESLVKAYAQVRQALIRVVHRVHPEREEVDGYDRLRRLGDMFRQFGSLFTTSYDLIAYWAIMTTPERFTDFFRNGLYTPARMQETSRIPLFFLHGALHLYQDGLGIKKATARSRHETLPATLGRLYADPKLTPLFVSEGHSKQKLRSILANEYLSFCFDNLRNLEEGVTVFGLSFENDDHIVDAINKSSIERVAYGIYTKNRGLTEIAAEQERIRHKFRKRVVFYDSLTFGAGIGSFAVTPGRASVAQGVANWW